MSARTLDDLLAHPGNARFPEWDPTDWHFDQDGIGEEAAYQAAKLICKDWMNSSSDLDDPLQLAWIAGSAEEAAKLLTQWAADLRRRP